MTTITREWLQQKIAGMEAARDKIPYGLSEDGSNTLAAMRIALASLEAEAVAFRSRLKAPWTWYEGWDYIEHRTPDKFELENCDIEQLYTAPPAPVSVPECFKRLLHHAYGMTMGHDWNKGTMAGHHRTKLCQAVEECRAAMLQGAERVTSTYKLSDAVEALRNSGIAIDAEKIQEELDALNSPVIPDGSLPDIVLHMVQAQSVFLALKGEMLSERVKDPELGAMGATNIQVWTSKTGGELHFETSNGGCTLTIKPHGDWVACSERMPENDDFVYIWPRPDFGVELHVAQYGKFDKRDAGWYAQVYEQNYGIEYYPVKVTHWMPLPAAPQQEVK